MENEHRENITAYSEKITEWRRGNLTEVVCPDSYHSVLSVLYIISSSDWLSKPCVFKECVCVLRRQEGCCHVWNISCIALHRTTDGQHCCQLDIQFLRVILWSISSKSILLSTWCVSVASTSRAEVHSIGLLGNPTLWGEEDMPMFQKLSCLKNLLLPTLWFL